MTPSSVTSQHTESFVSTFDIHKPAIRNTLFRKYGDQGLGFFNVIDTLGNQEAVDQTYYSHFEENWIHQAVTVKANVASPGAGNPIDFTLAVADLDANNKFYIAVGDDVMFANQVTGYVTAIDITTPAAPVVTVQPHSTTDNIGALLLGAKVVIYSNNYAEGTGQPEGKVTKPSKYTFNTKIVKETNTVTGSEMTNGIYTDKTSDGKSIESWYMKGQIDADYRMMLRMDGAMLFDRPTTNAVLTASGNRTIFGLVPWVRSGGNVDNYNTGFFAMADFDANSELLDSQFAPQEVLAMLGIKLQNEWENLFVNTFDDGAIQYANGQSAMDLNIDFKSFRKSERRWHLKRMQVFNHPQLYGAAGFKISGMGVICPMDNRKVSMENGSTNKVASFGMRYKALGSYNRKMKTWLTGGAKASTNQFDKDELNVRAEFGSHYVANNRFMLIEQN